MTAQATFCDECGASNPLQATRCFACDAALYPSALSPLLLNRAASTNVAILSNRVLGLLAPASLLHSRYSIVRQIGTGGFGAVYQAKDTLFSHRLVAIKEMSQDGLTPRELADATAAFEREALLLADLTHPNLPRIHDHFSEHGRSYVVMDFIAGDTLEDYLDKVVRRSSVEAALEIGIQLATVLDYLHTRQPPIIFRDLKPANIMRTADNDVYLIDFGIARHFKPGKAKDTIPLGSKGYAAPEQYGKAQSTSQSDIYGLGATLHQLLTGDDPSLTPFRFVPVRIGNSPIAAPLNALLKQMLEMEMSKRPTSMAVVKRELERLLALQTAEQLSQSQKYVRTRMKRRSFLIGFVSVVATCSVSSAITTYVFDRPNLSLFTGTHPLIGNTPVLSPSPPGPSPAGATLLTRPLYTYRGHHGSVTAVAWSSNGRLIASAGTLDSSVQVWDASTGSLILIPTRTVNPAEKKFISHEREPNLLATNGQGGDALAWSSDSTRLASALGNDAVDVWSIATGDESIFPLGSPGDANALAWSPNGDQIAAVSGNTSVEVRSATTGNLLFTYSGHTQAVLTLAWSPDGKHIASGGLDGIVQVWNAATGYTQVTYRGQVKGVNAVAWSPNSGLIASGGADGTVQVWDGSTGRTLLTYGGHVGGVNTVAWQAGSLLLHENSLRVASGGDDATVQVWSFGKTENTQEMALEGKILIYRGHTAQVTSVTWAPDGQRIASGSADGTVQIWRAM